MQMVMYMIFPNVHSLYYYGVGQPGTVNERVKNARKEAIKRLDGIYDGKYESFAEKENNVAGLKNWAFIPGLLLEEAFSSTCLVGLRWV
jgi:hypothetical protein